MEFPSIRKIIGSPAHEIGSFVSFATLTPANGTACHYKHGNEASVRQGVGQWSDYPETSWAGNRNSRELLRGKRRSTRSRNWHKALLASRGTNRDQTLLAQTVPSLPYRRVKFISLPYLDFHETCWTPFPNALCFCVLISLKFPFPRSASFGTSVSHEFQLCCPADCKLYLFVLTTTVKLSLSLLLSIIIPIR